MSKYFLDIDTLANLVRSKRQNRGLRATSSEIGNISSSTISRIENGKTPDIETFLALCDWLEVSPTELIKENDVRANLNIPEEISFLLRSDRTLDPAVANALALIIDATYKHLADNS
jgi:transcriptional regulator with XRE-family HTH domain